MTFVGSMDILEKISLHDPNFTHLDLRHIKVKTKLLEEIAHKLDTNTFVNRVSWRNEWHYRVDLKKRIEEKVELNFKKIPRHPNDFTHALLSYHVYRDSTAGSSVQFSLENDGEEAETWNQELRNWSVLKVFDYRGAGRYYSIAYLNQNEKQVVLAHRGTSIEYWDMYKIDSPLATDIDGILGGKIVKQQEKAFRATQEVIKLVKTKGWNVSFTGHSLGAWLAELSLYFAVKNFEYFKSKAVTFDSPGSASTLKSFKSNVNSDETDQTIQSLDVTTYLSAPNVVNCCNQHIGKVYRIFPIIKSGNISNKLGVRLKKILLLKHIEPLLTGYLSFSGHSIRSIVATFDLVTGKPVKFEKVLDWPHIKYQPSTNDTNVGSIIRRTINSIPVVKWFSGIARWANEILPKPTLWKAIEVLDQFVSGNIDSRQFCETWEHLEFKAETGHPLNHTVPLLLEEQFALYYEGHYCTQELTPFQDVYDTRKSDWYLNKLWKLSHDKLEKKVIDGSIKQSLRNLKDKYKIKTKGNTKYICVLSADIQVDDLREEIVNLCERYEEIKQILEDKNAYSPRNNALNRSSMIINDLPPRSVNIVERPKVLEDIGEVLNEHKFLIISAFGGTGKTTIAQEYGRYVKKNFSDWIVRFILAGSLDKVNSAYKLMAQSELKINNVAGQDPKQIMQSVHTWIAASKSSVLFIFDNVESSENVESYIQGISNLDSCRVIITTRDKNLGNCLNLPTYELDPFTIEEAKLYLERNLAKNRFSPNDTEYLIYHLSFKNLSINSLDTEHLHLGIYDKYNNVLPYSLSHAVAYFNKDKVCSVELFIESLKMSGDPTGTYLLMDLLDMSELSFHVLQYIAYLDPDFIPKELIQKLFNVNDDSLNHVITRLESLSLVNLRTMKYGQHSFQVHRLVQHCVKNYANSFQHLKAVINEKNILEEIIQVLCQIFPIVTEVPNKHWRLSQKLYPHAVKILEYIRECNIHCNKLVEISKLNGKLGDYNRFVACNFSQALKYYKENLSLNQEVYADFGDKSDTDCLPHGINTPSHLYSFVGDCSASEHANEADSKVALEKPEVTHPYISASHTKVGTIYLELGKTGNGLKYLEEALENNRALYRGSNHHIIATSLHNLGQALRLHGEVSKALKYELEGLEMRRALHSGQNHSELATSLHSIGHTYTILGERKKGLEFIEEAFAMRQKLYAGLNHPEIADSLASLSSAYGDLGETEKSLKHAEAALEMRRKLYSEPNHPDIAESLYRLSNIYTNLGETIKGRKYGKEALEMRRAIFLGQNHPLTAKSCCNVARTYYIEGETPSELKYAKEGLQMMKGVYPGQNHPDIAAALNLVGCIYEKLSERGKAIRYFEEALKMERALYPTPNHPQIATSLNNIGFCLMKLDETSKALKYLDEALQMRKTLHHGKNHPKLAESLNNIAIAYGKNNEPTQELKYAEEALQMRKTLHHGKNHPKVAESLNNIAIAYGKNKEPIQELKYAKEALKMRQTLYSGRDSLEIAESLFNLSNIYTKLNRTADALIAAQEAFRMREAVCPGQNHSKPAASLCNLSHQL